MFFPKAKIYKYLFYELFNKKVDKRIVENIPLIKSLLEEKKKRLILNKVAYKSMLKILEYVKYNKDNPAPIIEKPIKTGKLHLLVGEWYASFVDLKQDEIFDLINSAEVLGLKSLVDLGCAKIASLMRKKKPKEIVAMFGIEKDFTPEQEACINKEYKWTENLL